MVWSLSNFLPHTLHGVPYLQAFPNSSIFFAKFEIAVTDSSKDFTSVAPTDVAD